MSEFSGKTVLITGGTRGIGRACAVAFAREGAQVAICGRTAATAQTAAAEIAAETGGKIAGFEADIASSTAVDALVKSITEALGPIYVLVNNAGITRDGLLMRMKPEDWSAVIDTNLTGAFNCCRAVSRDMLKQKAGRIINVSSIIGIRGQGGQTNYAAAKAGLIGFSKALAQELASRNITVNVVAPGYIDTDMTAVLSEELRAGLIERIPMRRQGTGEDIAAAVKFLAGEGAAYITGAVLQVDGGLAM
ncbi:MAG: 3-oxoacyl-[acyl-carrier-protein] reductase [Candidatus Hydrogenedentes bacterium]|nr:3-oxoacyl-[acyl-carrier-protein] reductase [Candidatus Hydrogenedentota bacterium]